MAIDGEIMLGVRLDTKDAVKDANDLEKEVENIFNKSSGKDSAALTGVKKSLKDTNNQIQSVRKELEELGTKKIPTQAFTELEKEYNKLTDKIATKEVQMKDFRARFKGDNVQKDSTYKKMSQEITHLRVDLSTVEEHMDDLVAKGKSFTLGKDTKEYEEKKQKLESLNDKQKQTIVKYREMADASEKSGKRQVKSVSKVGAGFGNLIKLAKKVLIPIAGIVLGVRGLYGIFNKLRSAIREGFSALYEGDKEFKKQVDDLKKSCSEIKANLAAAFMPIIQMAIPYIQQLLNYVNELIQKLSMFVAAIAGQKAYTKAIKATTDAAKGAVGQLSKLDELNNLTSSGGGSDWSTEQVPIDSDILSKAEKLKALIEEMVQKAKELVINPFKEGLNFGEIAPKFEKLWGNLKETGKLLYGIFTDPRVQTSAEEYIKTISNTFGKVVGSALSIGAEFANLFTEGFNQFLTDHQDEIAEFISGIYGKKTEIAEKIGDVVDSLREIFDGISENQDAIDTASNLFSILWELYSTYADTQLQIFVDIANLSASPIVENVEEWKKTLNDFLTFAAPFTASVLNLVTKICDAVKGITTAVSTVAGVVGGIIASVVRTILNTVSQLLPVFQAWIEYIIQFYDGSLKPIVDDVISIIIDIADIVEVLWKTYVEPFINWIVEHIVPVLVPLLKILGNLVIGGLKLVFATIKPIFATMKDAVEFLKAAVHGDIHGALQALGKFLYDLLLSPFVNIVKVIIETSKNSLSTIKQLLVNLWDFLKSLWAVIWGWIVDAGNRIMDAVDLVWWHFDDLLKTLGLVLGNVLNNIIQMLANAVNEIIDLINGIKFEFPSWIPVVGGQSVNPNIPHVNWTGIPIPALATGTVIPPSMGRFIAQLGDNNKETEVVSPLSTIKEALIEAIQEVGGMGGGEIHIHVDLDGREVAKSVVRQNDIYRKTKGRSLFA